MITFGVVMEPNAKKRWVEALRSGQYPQGMNYLVRVDEDGNPVGYCCLGVQAVIENVPNKIADSGGSPHHLAFAFSPGDEKSTYPTPGWFGRHLMLTRGELVPITSHSLEPGALNFYAENIMSHLADMNDRLVPFTEIADWIDVNL